VELRAGLHTVEKRRILPLPGIEPRPKPELVTETKPLGFSETFPAIWRHEVLCCGCVIDRYTVSGSVQPAGSDETSALAFVQRNNADDS
jgi:hypothetical protein